MFKSEDLRVVAEAFLYPEDSSFLELIPYLVSLGRRLGLYLNGDFGGENLEDLRVEYTRLFITSPYRTPAPPYASVYLSGDRRLKGEGYDQALAFYREAGYQPVEEGDLADHVAYELAFMALLLEEGRRDLLARFLTEHFLKWYPRFLGALRQAQPRPFYRALGDLVLFLTNRLREEVAHEKKGLS
ncbi:molecular chaperone [Thermosulfurimonas sp. F29]|uniref:TorD/DmsD family molecular chaperone n=1 Tax=Thermosulfurimonas sp. F29 TaxID=2867247 RepID=UPI001C83DA18|nr:molecular chaperone TorD family protein [Thermosulfurimonas sp. F29]MBX6422178.1 molecular chaperone TorD family protein [Thermosulfurimonas sp. F29]